MGNENSSSGGTNVETCSGGVCKLGDSGNGSGISFCFVGPLRLLICYLEVYRVWRFGLGSKWSIVANLFGVLELVFGISAGFIVDL